MHTGSDRTGNLAGAWSLAVTDAVRRAVEGAAGGGGAVPAALVTIDAYPGETMEHLGAALRLSQPGTLRLVERLENEGWARRRPGPGRAAGLVLTAAGRRAKDRSLAARDRTLAQLLDPLSAPERAQLAELLEKLLAAQTDDRVALTRLCRLCHRAECERCPVSAALR
jgi:MarR family transcriptional regulator, negative regulator of the multidrug operon emrRAB